MIETIPVVLFVYRRPDIVEQTLKCLERDSIPLLYVFSDGPKGRMDEVEVLAVRRLVQNISWCKCHIFERRSNLGLGNSVLMGMDTIFVHHEAAIVFEDDLSCVPGTYDYLSAALNAYRDNARVMSVTAWTHPAIVPDDIGEDPYFDGKAECWAWGTWRRSWHGMNVPAATIMQDFAAEGGDVARYGPDMPIMAEEAERRNLWAIRWWYHHMRHAGLCLRPPWSMVEHHGWDTRSTTTTPAMLFWANPPLASAPTPPEVWPEPIERSECPDLWCRAILASGAGPFPPGVGVRTRNTEHYEAIYADLDSRGIAGWNLPEVDQQVIALLDDLLMRARPQEGAATLELGCGTGAITQHLCSRGLVTTAIDVAPTAIEGARQRLKTIGSKATLIVGDARNLLADVPVASFDLVIDSLLLHNLVGYDRTRLFEQIRQALRPGGTFLIMSMCGVPRDPRLRAAFDHRTGLVMNGSLAELTFRTPARLHAELNGNGFQVVYECVREGGHAPGEEDVYLAVAIRCDA